MRLISVRIENFKCIEDTGIFKINQVTCLVGKNESGKTAILHALEKLKPTNPDKGDFESLFEYPRHRLTEYEERADSSPDNVLTTEWELDEAEIESLEGFFGVDCVKSKNITISKGYSNVQKWRIDLNIKIIADKYLDESGLDEEEMEKLKACNSVSEIIKTLNEKDNRSENEQNFLNQLNNKFERGSSCTVSRDR